MQWWVRFHADVNEGHWLCPFCRTPAPRSDGELIERMKKRADGDDAIAM